MDDDFYRIQRLPPYVFAEVNAMKAAARARGRGHHRPRHGQSRRRAAAACHRQAGRSRAQARRAPLFGSRRASPACARRRRLITSAASASTLDPDTRSHRHAGLEGRPRQPRPGDHRAGRRRARAQPELPDPHLRLHHRRRRDPLDPGRARTRTSSSALDRAMRFTVPRPKVLVVGYPSNPTAYVGRPRLLRAARRLRARERALGHLRPRLCRALLRRHADALDPAGARARRTSRSSSPRMSKTYSMAGWRIGFAVGNATLIAALTRVKSYLDYGAFTPIQAAAVRRAQRAAGHRRDQPRALQEAPRRAGRKLRPRRLGHPAAAGRDVRLGADPRALRATGQRWNSPSSC